MWDFFSLRFISNYSIRRYLNWAFCSMHYVTLIVNPSPYFSGLEEPPHAPGSFCHPMLPIVSTNPEFWGLSKLPMGGFVYPKGRRKESSNYCWQTFLMKGREALLQGSSGVGFSEVLLQTQTRTTSPGEWAYLGSLGDLLAREILGDFLAAQSSLSSTSLESEQLQLSSMEEIKLFP